MNRSIFKSFPSRRHFAFKVTRAAVAVMSMAATTAFMGSAFAAGRIAFSSASPGLDFGSFVVLSSCSNCTITISNSGVRTASSGIVLISGASGSAGAFAASGTNSCGSSCSYTVTTPPASASITAGTVTMSVGSFTYRQTAATTPNTLYVGATLTIPSSGSTPRSYTSSTYTVTTNP